MMIRSLEKMICIIFAVRDYSNGDVLIFHDVDYVPDDEVTYELDNQEVCILVVEQYF